MKIFGLDISRSKKSSAIAIKEVSLPAQSTQSAPGVKNEAKISSIRQIKTIPALQYSQTGLMGRSDFKVAEYDLTEIGVIEDTEAFVRQAFKKKIGLMFKEGVGYSGSNKDALQYLKIRMAQIARASCIPTISLMKRTAFSLIRTSNAFLIKVRDAKISGGQVRKTPDGKTLQPIAGYFPAAPETMRPQIDQQTGKVTAWRQVMPDGQFRDYLPEDVVHFTLDRREGFVFGVPSLVPAKDDIRALRAIEENIELLLHQHLFPLFHFKVGTETNPAGIAEDGQREVDLAKREIELMPAEGGIVTSERYEINAIGAEGRAVRSEGYLEHFKKRVFAGLGISQIDMGDGDTSNRATAHTLSRALIDTVKDIQDEFETQWNHMIIEELLLESTFGVDVLELPNMVYLKFAEIDIQNKMDQEKHALDMFKGNALTYEELRAACAREPIILPEDPEDQDLSKYPEWAHTYWKLFDEPTQLIRAVDEPFSAAAIAAAGAKSTAITQKGLATETAGKEKVQAAELKAKTTPRPVARQSIDNFITPSLRGLENDLATRIKSNVATKNNPDLDYLRSLSYTWASSTARKLETFMMSEFRRGYASKSSPKHIDETILSMTRTKIQDRSNILLKKLVQDIIKLVSRRVDSVSTDVKLTALPAWYSSELHNAFDSLRYRADFIWDVESRRAFSYGQILALSSKGHGQVKIVNHGGSCAKCSDLNGKIVHISTLDMEDIVPVHPGCNCSIELVNDTQDSIQDEAIEDAPTKMERCVLQVKQQMRKKHPDWDEKRVKSSAYAICTASLGDATVLEGIKDE